MWHGKSRRKLTGGKVKYKRKRRKHELGRETLPCKVSDEDRRKKIETRGKGNTKQRLQLVKKINLADPETGKTSKEDIEEVTESPANPHFTRRNIVTKGSIVQTSGGRARITSRPGQSGQVNAVKLED